MADPTGHWHATTGESDSPLNGYPAWEAAFGRQATFQYVLLFVDIAPALGLTLSETVENMLAADRFLFSPQERLILEFELQNESFGQLNTLHTAIVWPRSDAALSSLPHYITIRHIGEPIPDVAQVTKGATAQSIRPLGQPVNQPIIAVIDDGIAHLNHRFRDANGKTRFLAIWRQNDFVVQAEEVLTGPVLTRRAIQAQIDSNRAESTIYNELDADLAPNLRGQLAQHTAHGTHVLDLAANADEDAGSAIRSLPILGVQLPPAAVRATSGRRLDGYIAAGLRWIVTEAIRNATVDGIRPLIVNLSLGSLGGAGDGSTFLAQWMRDEISRYDRITGTTGRMHIVAAYGNARLDRLVADAVLTKDTPLDLQWQILPDDRSDSFLELRTDTDARAQLTLRAPDPDLAPFSQPCPQPGQQHLLKRNGRLIAGIFGYRDANGGNAVLIATAPTCRPVADAGPQSNTQARGGLAPSGPWQISLTTDSATPTKCSAKVQRDDTPGSYQQLGRQSALNSTKGWQFDPQTGANNAPAPGNPVTRQGTAVSFAGQQHPQILLVGAYRPTNGMPNHPEPTLYSAEGTAQSGPDLSARGDDGYFTTGILAAGVLSGSTARLSGTSVAAPQVTRALALSYLRKTEPGPTHPIGADPVGDAKLHPRLGKQWLRRAATTRAAPADQ